MEDKVFIYPNTLSTFHGDRQIALESGYIEITKEEYQHLLDNELVTTFIKGNKVTLTREQLNAQNN